MTISDQDREIQGNFNKKMEELEIKLGARREKMVDGFYSSLKPGELLQVVVGQRGVSIYHPKDFETIKLSPTVEAGDVIMYLGWVDEPGEEIVLVPPSEEREGVSRVLTGPKWLIGGRVWITTFPVSSIVPYQLEFDDLEEVLPGVDLEAAKKWLAKVNSDDE